MIYCFREHVCLQEFTTVVITYVIISFICDQEVFEFGMDDWLTSLQLCVVIRSRISTTLSHRKDTVDHIKYRGNYIGGIIRPLYELSSIPFHLFIKIYLLRIWQICQSFRSKITIISYKYAFGSFINHTFGSVRLKRRSFAQR